MGAVCIVYGSGDIEMRTRLRCDAMLPYLPRVGVHMRLAPDLQEACWLGCENETYPDRKVRRNAVAAFEFGVGMPSRRLNSGLRCRRGV